ncbi:4Fe-4S dicluster domain-containing protein [sulfur-oxidizing endosymbiont of Gigantopelta aegis]|uniref:4Fe-4S dicluster domain-containing protein n=1 Tax=sulfur-oxidizing endosymbiont of Gigantopelta aegis TaxID=2794934 RepID=UPI0018DDF030|nr:4Fe-4S dicluster domain-containing protein [sulfur-oxidizing endosymbiont of Gigantopelta aegis]
MKDSEKKLSVKTKTITKGPGKRAQQARRQFLRSVALTAGVTSISMLGFIPLPAEGKRQRLRPPGALPEAQYLSSCIKCGQCVQVCPVNAVKLDDIDSGYGLGTAYIDAREQACDFSCDGLQCVLACPTGSLTHTLDYSHDTRMGFAVFDKPKLCLAVAGKGFKGQARGPDYEGLLRYEEIDRWNPIPLKDNPYDVEICDLCVQACPIEQRYNQCQEGKYPSGDENQCPPQRAIGLELITESNGVKHMKPVIYDGCVGCGVCEMICPTAVPSIIIDYDKLTKIPLSEHYMLKSKKGGH